MKKIKTIILLGFVVLLSVINVFLINSKDEEGMYSIKVAMTKADAFDESGGDPIYWEIISDRDVNTTQYITNIGCPFGEEKICWHSVGTETIICQYGGSSYCVPGEREVDDLVCTDCFPCE